jgi:hypothetical protein
MIQDQTVLQNIQNSWTTVRLFQSMVNIEIASPVLSPFGFPPSVRFEDFCHNLVLVFAFSVLENVLTQLKYEKYFPSKKIGLEKLMLDSRKALVWLDFDVVNQGRDVRNKIAHHRKIVGHGDCARYIDAIEAELRAWRIIS